MESLPPSNCPWERGTRELFKSIKTKKISANELWKYCHGRAQEINGETKAYYQIFDKAFAGASVDSSNNVLLGAPVALKDFIFAKGNECTAGSAILEKFIAPYSASCVQRLVDHGGVILGRTSMDEFGMGSSSENSFQGPVMNPWNLSRSPGGSSGGSAAAVAAGSAPFALGTDTGGSVRQPAAFCGITGLKPSYGRVSRFGVISFASSLDQVGTLGLDAYGCAKLLESISGQDDRDPTTSHADAFKYEEPGAGVFKGLKIAIPDLMEEVEMDGNVKAAFEDFKIFLKTNGAILATVPMPLLKYSLAVYYLICTSEASSNLSRYDGVHLGFGGEKNVSLAKVMSSARSLGFGSEVKRRILLGTFALSAGYRDAFFNKAAKVRRLIKESYESIFESYDLILTPTTLESAFKIGDRIQDPIKMYNSDRLTIGPSLAGLPAISFPAASSGLPVGMQLVAPYFKEQRLLEVVDAYQEASDGFRPGLAPYPFEGATHG